MIEGSVNTENGEKMKIKCEGKVNVNHFTKTGYESKGTLSVKVVEGLKIKLFSFTTALSNGWIMNGYKQKNGEVVIMLTQDWYPAIIFDQMIKCGSSILMGAKMKILNIPQGIYLAQEKKMSKKSFHQKTGHATNAFLQDTAKYYGIELTGTIPTCVSCSNEKIRQKNIPKENPSNSKTLSDQMYLDISSMAQARSGGNKHWALMVDEATKYKKSFFLKRKNDQVEVIIDWLKELKNKYKIKVQRIRMDNAGENKMLVKSCDQNEMGIKFEYTAPGTPQQNGVVERAFVTLIGRGSAMMNHAGFTVKKRQEM